MSNHYDTDAYNFGIKITKYIGPILFGAIKIQGKLGQIECTVIPESRIKFHFINRNTSKYDQWKNELKYKHQMLD